MIHFRSLALTAAVALLVASCESPQQSDSSSATNPDGSKQLFRLLNSRQTNVDFSDDIVETPEFHYFLWDHAYTGSGVGIGDFNNDDLPDIFFTATLNDDALYINKGDLKFENIAEQAGVISEEAISKGITIGDVNNDGWQDIYISKSGLSMNPNERRNVLFINNGDLTFTEQAQARGVDDFGWSINASFFDYDKDGDLDLYVLNQPPSTRLERQDLTLDREHLYYDLYKASDRLYQNDGNGYFTDVSKQAGIENFAYGLAVITSDINGDNWPDIYVSNDYNKSDRIYINMQDGTFQDMGHEKLQHVAWFSMGADVNDFNNDGYPDVVAVDMPGKNHYRSKTNMGSMSPELFAKTLSFKQIPQFMFNVLQLSNGGSSFSDVGHFAGVSKTDWSWSSIFGDYDNDGWKDIFITNGIKRDVRNNDFSQEGLKYIEEEGGYGKADPLKVLELAPSNPIANFMFRNKGDLKFEETTTEWGLDLPGFSHGMAHADLDNDGDLDIVINNVDAEASIYENLSTDHHWLRLRLSSASGNRPVHGTKVYLITGDEIQFQESLATRGFLSCSENVIHFGLGSATSVDKAVIIWPDGRITEIMNPGIDQVHEVNDGTAQQGTFNLEHDEPLFAEVTDDLGFSLKHYEKYFNDYSKQVLLPYQYSQLGPAMDVGDVNGDGLEDVFIGGGANQPALLMFQTANGFVQSEQPQLTTRAVTEDLGAKLFDIDLDGDLDLFVASGSYEFEYDGVGNTDQIYINDGKGLMQATGFAGIKTPTKAISAADYDRDGDIDLFVGGRVVPGQYPIAPPSYLYENLNGRLTDITAQIVFGEGQVMGMVTDSEFSDYDGDGDLDLIVVGEWSAIKIFENRNGSFHQVADNSILNELTGLWQSVTAGDFDGNGAIDYLCGNLGTNNKFKASKEKPFKVMGQDFDSNGKFDVVLVTYYDGKEVPTRGRECSSEQLPFIAEKFPTFEEFATASIDDIFDEQMRSSALQLEVNTMKSGILFNNGNGGFTFKELPNELQISPIMDAVVTDWNGDGNADVIGVGNLLRTEIETLPYDAGTGFYMEGLGNGEFKIRRGAECGMNARNDAKGVRVLTLNDGSKCVIVANNNAVPQVFHYLQDAVQ